MHRYFSVRGHNPANKNTTWLSAIIAMGIALFSLQATAQESAADRDGYAASLAQAVPKGTRLVVAEQLSQASIPWNLSGAGKDAPYSISFANFNGGPAVLEALVAGAADIGYIGEAPLPIAVANNVKDLVAVGIFANPGSNGNIYLVAQPDSGIKTVADLKGRSVAYPPGTGRHMVLSGILHQDHLSLGTDVKGIPLAGTEVAPTFSAKAVDSAIVLGNQYFRLGKPPLIADGSGHNWGLNVLLVRQSLLDDKAKSAAVADFLRRAIYFNNWVIAHPDDWINATYVKQQGLTFDEGKWLYDKSGVGYFYPIDGEMAGIFQGISDGLYATGALKTPVAIAPYLDGRFNEIVARQNQLDGVTPRPLQAKAGRQ